jgi:hypothetical protein
MSSLSPHISARPQEWETPSKRSSRLGLRVRVLMHGRRLDDMLAGGADPAATPELAERARQLTCESRRRTLADGLDHAVCVAEGQTRRASAAPLLANRDIRASRAVLLGLAQALRECPVVDAMGVAQAQRLLTDGASPLYIESHNDALWHAARRATAALEGRTWDTATRRRDAI